jgi:DNA-binding MarR family transcriptional regulator
VNRPAAARVLDNEPIPITRRLVAARLCAFLKIAVQSARLAFQRTSGFSNSDSCILAKIAEHGPLTPTELVELLSYDKAHVSRSVTHLVNERVLSRDAPHGALSMTRTGRASYTRVLRLAKSRNAQILRDLTEHQGQLLPAVMAKLETNARALLAVELARQRPRDQTAQSLTPRVPARRRKSLTPPHHRFVIPELVALQNLIFKSAALAVGRELGLSEIDWQLVSTIGEHAPLTRIELVAQMSQPTGPVARALRRVQSMGIVALEKIGGGRHVLVSITAPGRKTYDRIMQLALQRNAVLMRGLTPADQQEFSAIIDRLMINANTLLVREQSLAS